MSASSRGARSLGAAGLRQPDYLAYVPKLGSAELKRVARLWVGPEANQANKDACAAAIRAGLEDPERVRALVARLSEFERAVLGVLKARGGTAAPGDLASEVVALGIEAPPSRQGFSYRDDGQFDLLNRVLEKGLILAASPSSSWDRPSLHLSASYSMPELVFSDPRLLAAVEAVPPRPLEVASVATAGTAWVRRPGGVLLDLLHVVETVRRLGDIPATMKEQPTAAAMKRLTKALGWDRSLVAAADSPGLRCPTPFYVGLLQRLGLLACDEIEQRLALSPRAGTWLERPYRTQAKAWVDAYRDLTNWSEDPDGPINRHDSSDESKLVAARAMLVQGLASLRGSRGVWFRCETFSEGLFERAGERVSLDYIPHFYPPYPSKTPAEVQKKRAEWREELRRRWRRREGPWIADALRGPLYELGLVEVALAPGRETGPPTCFRLTDLGRLALNHVQELEGTPVGPLKIDKSPGPCLVVQPNFEVIVYLDRAAPRTIAFLERAAERGSVGGATATYRLTRGSTYSAMEAGLGIGTLLKTLAEAAEHGLPPNVQATLRDWAARRDRLIVRRAVRLLEFPDAATRDAAASQGRATPLGERYLLLDPSVSRRASLAVAGRSIDYAGVPVQCLSVTEDGTVTLDGSRADLLIQTEVGRWADPEERGDDARWRITRESVARATRAGISAGEILTSLSARSVHACPPLLLAAIRAWGGARLTAALASAMHLHVPDRETFYAIATSPTLRRHFEGFLGSQTLVVNPGAREVLWRLLEELGLHLETDLRPAQMPGVFEPRPLTKGGLTTPSPSPVADREDEAKRGPLPLQEFQRIEDAIAGSLERGLLLKDLPEALNFASGSRRRRGRPRLRP